MTGRAEPDIPRHFGTGRRFDHAFGCSGVLKLALQNGCYLDGSGVATIKQVFVNRS
ncbi:hypothetical protein CBM2625_B50009 [Cupriavidus taiwanensis]|nr:hypothetical protein CBM2614_B50010 [Cupriavidus taiwanensis]SPA09720.1 hypothetical protein CBM2625_B50009 [Cupriavidus taiwanensis]